MIGWGGHFRVSAIRRLVRVIRFRFGLRKSALCHLSSIQPSFISGGGWRLQVAGGRNDPFSPPFSPYPRQLGQHAVLTLPQDSVLK